MSADATEKQASRLVLKASTTMMRHELRRFKLSDRTRLLAELILSLSWSEGLSAVRVPKLEFFQALTGLGVPHVSTALRELELMRVVKTEESADGKWYAINPLSETWQATPRQSRTTIMEAINLLREINGVAREKETERNFKVQQATTLLAEKFPTLVSIPSLDMNGKERKHE